MNSKSRFLTLFMVLTMVMPSVGVNTYAATIEEPINETEQIQMLLQEKSYVEDQLDNEVLFEMAKKGELVDNEHTKTNIREGEYLELDCNKFLSEKMYSDGTVVKSYEAAKCIYLTEDNLDAFTTTSSIEDSDNILIANLSESNIWVNDAKCNVSLLSSKPGEGKDGSYTVKINATCYYEEVVVDGNTYAKVTSTYCVPTLLDNTFKLTNLNILMGMNSFGHVNSSLERGGYLRKTKEYNISPVISGSGYTRYSYFTDYAFVGGDFYAIGSDCTLSFERVSGSSTSSFELEIRVP